MSHHVWNWSKSTQNSKCQELPWLLNTSLPPAAKKNQWNVLKIYIFCRHMLQMLRKKTLILMALYPNLSLFFKKPNSVWSRTTFRTCTAVVIEARYKVFVYLFITRQTIIGNPSKFQECKFYFSTYCYNIARGRSLWTLLKWNCSEVCSWFNFV